MAHVSASVPHDDEPKTAVPALRIARCNRAAVRGDGRFVLYWMTAARRTQHNFALDRALDWAEHLQRPLLVLEALRADYPWASARLHRFALDGMADNARALARGPVGYYPRVEPEPGADHGLLEALAAHACVVVTDEYPCFFLPRMIAAAAPRLPVALEQVDGNGLLPLRAPGRLFTSAFSLRAYLQKELLPHLAHAPRAQPLRGRELPRMPELPSEITQRWPAASQALLAGDAGALRALPIAHDVAPVALRGGSGPAAERIARFLAHELARYPDARNHPDDDAGSGLSPYLHFGHAGAHQLFSAIAAQQAWRPERTRPAGGRNRGFWGTSPAAEAFLDQLVTWRELGFNFCYQRDDYAQYRSLPEWARATLSKHARDRRPERYDLAELEQAATADPLWNAAQRQLLREGRIHNYLRMLWGKKILEWSDQPERALEIMIALNDKYALDGRDPNSYNGIAWTLGRYDRPWGPERPIFGTVRYMSSQNTQRKLRVKQYLARYA